MELRKIDTLEELQREKARLRKEAQAARDLFQDQLAVVADSGKQAIIGNWKTIIPVAAAAGMKRFLNNSIAEASIPETPASGTGNWLGNIQEGISIIQRPGSDKWFSLVPVIMRLWEQWKEQYLDLEEELLPGETGRTSDSDQINTVVS